MRPIGVVGSPIAWLLAGWLGCAQVIASDRRAKRGAGGRLALDVPHWPGDLLGMSDPVSTDPTAPRRARQKPGLTARAQAAHAARAAREAAALRANLLRRKQQARARDDAGANKPEEN